MRLAALIALCTAVFAAELSAVPDMQQHDQTSHLVLPVEVAARVLSALSPATQADVMTSLCAYGHGDGIALGLDHVEPVAFVRALLRRFRISTIWSAVASLPPRKQTVLACALYLNNVAPAALPALGIATENPAVHALGAICGEAPFTSSDFEVLRIVTQMALGARRSVLRQKAAQWSVEAKRVMLLCALEVGCPATMDVLAPLLTDVILGNLADDIRDFSLTQALDRYVASTVTGDTIWGWIGHAMYHDRVDIAVCIHYVVHRERFFGSQHVEWFRGLVISVRRIFHAIPYAWITDDIAVFYLEDLLALQLRDCAATAFVQLVRQVDAQHLYNLLRCGLTHLGVDALLAPHVLSSVGADTVLAHGMRMCVSADLSAYNSAISHLIRSLHGEHGATWLGASRAARRHGWTLLANAMLLASEDYISHAHEAAAPVHHGLMNWLGLWRECAALRRAEHLLPVDPEEALRLTREHAESPMEWVRLTLSRLTLFSQVEDD